MCEKIILTHCPEQTMKLAKMISAVSTPGDVIILNGDLGSGKTVFAQGFSRGLNIEKNITSPTFTLSKKYIGKNVNLVHADIYRMLENISSDNHEQMNFLLDNIETLDFAKDEDDSIFLIEWGDAIKNYFPQGVLEIELDRQGDISKYKNYIDFAGFFTNFSDENSCDTSNSSDDEQLNGNQKRIIKIKIINDRYKKILEIFDK